MIDIRKLKELVRLMVANDLTEIDLRDSEEQVTLHRPGPGGSPVVQQIASPAAPASVAPSPVEAPSQSEPTTPVDDTVVCIVEAMKIFNEIKAETSGTIAKVLVSNGDAVEFGQDLFLVKPS